MDESVVGTRRFGRMLDGVTLEPILGLAPITQPSAAGADSAGTGGGSGPVPESPESRFAALRARQHGTFTRRQANEYGLSDDALGVRCRSGRIQRVHRGVFADFTGPLPWATRVWAAWLAYGPRAAIAGETALLKYGVDGEWDDSTIELDVPHPRHLKPPSGIRLNRCRQFGHRLHGSLEPALVTVEAAVLTVAGRQPTTDRAVALLLDVCRQRRTTADRLRREVEFQVSLEHRSLFLDVLDDAAGVQSLLEMSYLRRVERDHGLPAGTRQVRAAAGGTTVYRDVEYLPFGVVVELDGRVGHESAAGRWRDMARDNAAVLDGKATLRFGYQLVTSPCATAAQVGTVLTSRGWTGTVKRCGPSCTL